MMKHVKLAARQMEIERKFKLKKLECKLHVQFVTSPDIYLTIAHRAPVAQLIEQRSVTREVVSSTPVGQS